MKKIIATILSVLSLAFCFYVPAYAADNVSNNTTTVYTGSVCKKESHTSFKGMENVISHPFTIFFCGAGWGIVGLLTSCLLQVSGVADIAVCTGFVVGAIFKAVSLYKVASCN